MNTLTKKWNHFWFEPASADNLGLARIVLFGSMAIFYISAPYLFPAWGWHEIFSDWGGVSKVFWKPLWLFHVLHLPLLSTSTIAVMECVWKISLIFSAIGLFTRFSTAISFILCVYLFGLPNNFGRIHHLEIVLLWGYLIMAVTPCGDAWSIDRLIKTWRTGAPPAQKSAEYTWPIRLIWVIMALIYFEAGVSKLRHSGIGWVTSGTMAFNLERSQYHVTDAEPLTTWGIWIARHNWAAHLLAAMGLSLELSYPLALFNKRLRYLVMVSGMMMQTGIAVLMGPNFYQMIICQLLWLPLDKITYAFCGAISGKKTYAVIFDGSCGLCKRTIATVKSIDLLSKVEYLDAIRDWPQILQRYPTLDRDRCLQDMHAIDKNGKIRIGFDAYKGLAWTLPLGWLMLPLFYLPGAATIGKRIYRAVADERHSGACELPTPVGSGSPQPQASGKL